MEELTRAEVERIVKEEVKRQLQEQRTEEMKVVNVNVASKDVNDRLDTIDTTQRILQQELQAHSKAWMNTLQENYTEHKADILQLKESQADLRDRLIEQGQKLDHIEATMATNEALAVTATRINADMTAMGINIIKAVKELMQQKSDE